jgi:hypothetical protein
MAVRSNTRQSVMVARRVEGLYLANNARAKGFKDEIILEAFDDIVMH